MAATSSVSLIHSIEILPEIVNLENETVLQQKESEMFRRIFDSGLKMPCGDLFKNFVRDHLIVRCSDGKMRFQACYSEFSRPTSISSDCQSSPLAYLAYKYFSAYYNHDPKDHALFLLENYPKLMNIKNSFGAYPLHYLLNNLYFFSDAIKLKKESRKKVVSFDLPSQKEKIEKIFAILIHSEVPLHHDPIKDFDNTIIYSPIDFIINGWKMGKNDLTSSLSISFCSVIRNLIKNDKEQRASQFFRHFIGMPDKVTSLVHSYIESSFYCPEVLNLPGNRYLLSTAIRTCNSEGVKLLLELGADPHNPIDGRQENKDMSCLELARQCTLDDFLLEEYTDIRDVLTTHVNQRKRLNNPTSDTAAATGKGNKGLVYVSRPNLERTAPEKSKGCIIL